MIINSQFFISSYTGKKPLNLMTMPSEFTDDTLKISEYNKFIQNIDTIYGTQNIDGEIPKFWTRKIQTTDELGNLVYKYAPHPESTLTQLSTLQSYYFILRDSTAVPIRIPVNGGETIGFTDASSLPVVVDIFSFTAEKKETDTFTQIILTDNNAADINFSIENLRPTDSYIYEIESVGANWPLSVQPISGIIKPAKTTGIIDINVLFCPSTGICGDNVLDYTLIDECLFKKSDNIHSTIRMNIKPVSAPDMEVYSDQYSIVCENCLPPKPLVSILNTGDLTVQLNKNIIEDSFDGLAYHDFDISLTDFSTQLTEKTYSYQIETLSAEWPIIYVTPTGGILTLRSGQNRVSVGGKFFFCPATGLCQPGMENVPNYSIPTFPKFLLGEDSLSSVSKIKIRASVESYDCPGQKVYSNTSIISFIR